MRLAFLCLIGLIKSSVSYKTTPGNRSGNGTHIITNSHFTSNHPHQSSPHPFFELVEKQTPFDSEPIESPESPSSTDFTEATKLMTKRKIKLANYTMVPEWKTSEPSDKTTFDYSTSTTEETPWTSDSSNLTELPITNQTATTTAGPISTNIYLYLIYALTILFTIGSMAALCYLKIFFEKQNLKKGD